jgi:uncharacterized glyoxalase superfamily protein PhnB
MNFGHSLGLYSKDEDRRVGMLDRHRKRRVDVEDRIFASTPRQAPGSQQGLQLTVADIEATCAELAGRGVEVSQVMRWEDDAWIDGRGGEWNSFAFLNDPDGNGWILQERSRDRDDD